MAGKVYRYRPGIRMTWADWRIAIAIAFPAAFFVMLVAGVLLIG